MKIDVLSIFPDLIRGYTRESLLGRAIETGLVDLAVTDIRDFAGGPHRQVDDTVYGGGPGMVLKADVVAAALDSVLAVGPRDPVAPAGQPPAGQPPAGQPPAGQAGGGALSQRRILLSPTGQPLDHLLMHELSSVDSLVLVCGRYEGVDQRLVDEYDLETVSIGDYVLAGGELPALVLIEGVTRLIPGVMGNECSPMIESFESGLLEPPCYTRPAVWRGRSVPDVLRSGNHLAIESWRRSEALRLTAQMRPDLLRRAIADGVVTPGENGETR